MYRNIVYNHKKSEIKLFTWDKEGKRVIRDFKYKPYFYSETANKSEYKSIFDNALKKHEFENDFDRRKYIQTCGTDRIYGNLPPEHQFLIDAYWEHCKKDGFSQFPLSIYYVDIEVYSPNEFPDEWEAKHPINVITIYNSIKNEFRIFSLKRGFDPRNLSDENKKRLKEIGDVAKFKITHHATEKNLLQALVDYWTIDYPDIVSGWNLPFDIPYIINRIKTKFDEKTARRFSPVGNIREITGKKKIGAQFTVDVKSYDIAGVTILDYQDVYMKFNLKPVPNRKLDTILQIELGRGKVEYESSNLAKLADEDWDLFVFYNIEDVNGLKLLEEKLKFLQTARNISYMGLTSLGKSLDTLPNITGYCYINALEEGKIIPTFNKDQNDWKKFDGAYVKEPIPNIYEHIVSFDLNSLYPMTIITLNISPETKFGRVIRINSDRVIIEDNVGKQTTLSEEKYQKLLKTANLAVSKSGVLFTQNKRGIFPKLVEEVYSKRVQVKSDITKLKEDGYDKHKNEIQRLDAYQNALKVVINSLYGYCGNRYSPMSDIDMAESVTHTCQNVIKKSNDILEDIGIELTQVSNIHRVTYNDTDSNYFSICDILEKHKISFYTNEGLVNPKVVKLCGIIKDKLNERIKKWGETELNSKDCRFEFKMEAIADKAFFIAKKNYALHILNDEGFDVTDEKKRWKYKGIKLVSASMPPKVKPLVEKVLHKIILTKNKDDANKLYIDSFEKFQELSIDDIALIKSLNKLDEYVDECDGWRVAKGMQAHYRGGYYYNKLIDDLGLGANYEKIKQSDKVKFVYLNPNNKYGLNVISYIDRYPKEFEEIFEVDMELMFEKCIKDTVDQFYSALGWNLNSPNFQPVLSIEKSFFL